MSKYKQYFSQGNSRVDLTVCWHPGFEFQAHYLHFYQLIIELPCGKDKDKQKEAGVGQFFN